MKNWRQRQAAQKRADAERDFQARVGNLVGLGDPAPAGPDVVGWFQRAGESIRGGGHQCLTCTPERPLGFLPVTRNLLAATSPCTRCGKRLDGR